MTTGSRERGGGFASAIVVSDAERNGRDEWDDPQRTLDERN
jgi:hypothetical protein